MGRLMPQECQHGKIMSWGDFGGPDSEPEPCEECSKIEVLMANLERSLARAKQLDGGRKLIAAGNALAVELRKSTNFPHATSASAFAALDTWGLLVGDQEPSEGAGA